MMLQAEMFKVATMGNGFLAMMACPTLDPQAPASIRNIARLGIRQVVSLLEPSEARNLGLEAERLEVKAHAMEFISLPIPDMGVPPSVEDFSQVAQMLFTQVNAGINTLVHCRAGIGRSGLMCAGVLLHVPGERGKAFSVDEAFDYVSRQRGIRVPETGEQHEWLAANARAIVERQR